MDYWKECIEAAFEDAGINASEEQIEICAGVVEGAHENYGMAFGYDSIGHVETDAERELKAMKKEKENREMWEASTKPCRSCLTTGSVNDGWGRPTTCMDCDGKGRVRITW